MSELLDQHGSDSQLLLIGWVGELLTMPVPDEKLIMQFSVLIFEPGLGDIDVAHGQGIGERIEKRRSVIRPDVHDRIRRRLAVVERDVDGMEQTTERAAPFSELFDQLAVDGLPGSFNLAGVKESDHHTEFHRQAVVLLRSECRSANRLDAEDIHQFFSTQAGTNGRSSTKRS